MLSALNEDAQNGKMKPEFFPPKNPNVNLKRQFEKIFIQEACLKSIVFLKWGIHGLFLILSIPQVIRLI